MRGEGIAARLLSAGRMGYAARAVERLYVLHPDLDRDHPTSDQWRQELGRRIEMIEASLAQRSSEALCEDIRWNRQAYANRGVSPQWVEAGLLALREVLEEDLPSSAYREVEPLIDAAQQAYATAETEDLSFVDVDSPAGKLAAEFMVTILEGDRRRATRQILDAVDAPFSIPEIMLQVLMPVQAEVGRLWHLNELSIAEEHLVTQTVELALGLLYDRMPRDPPNGRVLVSGSIAGDLHDLGVRVVSDFFEMDGWRVIFLGPDVPPDDFARAAIDFEADLVLIGATRATMLARVKDGVAAVHQANTPRVPVLVGGQAFATEGAWMTTGAEAVAHGPEQAVQTGRSLVGLSS